MSIGLNVITRALGCTKLFLAKNAPEILMYGGLIVVSGGIFLFCKATTKLEGVIDEHDSRVEELENADISDDERKKLIFKEKMAFSGDICRLYAIPFATTMCGFGMILGGHYIIMRRMAAISAAYKTLLDGYNKYRQRVRDDLGEEADRRYLYGFEKESDDKDVATVAEADISGKQTLRPHTTSSPYARFFDEFSTQWTRNPEYNLMFLNSQQNYANDKLHSQGHLFLNEVYEMLGLPHTQAGSVVGWVLNKGGDNCVDFGIYDIRDEIKRAFVNGYEPSILLDFNVDGNIYDLI